MIKTRHSIRRQEQRGMSNDLLDIIEKNGQYIEVPGGAIKVHFGNREYQNVVRETKRFL